MMDFANGAFIGTVFYLFNNIRLINFLAG